MPSVKKQVLEMLRKMPDDVDLTDIMAELYFRQKVDAGLKELDEGKGIPHAKVKILNHSSRNKAR